MEETKTKVQKDIGEINDVIDETSKKQESSESDLGVKENELMDLIKQRERKPVGKIQKGYEVHFYNAVDHKEDNEQLWAKWYEAFDFESAESNKIFNIEHCDFPNKDDFGREIGKAIDFDGYLAERFLLKIVGVFTAPKDDTYTFKVNSDDGTYLYFGQHVEEHGKAAIQNGGAHGMVKKQASMTLKKGMEQQFVLTFWQNQGGAGLVFNINDSKGQAVDHPMHYESSMQRWFKTD